MRPARLLPAVALALCAAAAAPAAVPPPLPARGRAVWSGDLSLDTPVTVPAGATLVFRPGTRLRFGRAGRLVIKGALEASGTRQKPVRLLGSREAPEPCIATVPTASIVRLEHVELSGAAFGLHLQGGTVTLSSCRFERFGVAVSLDLRCRATLTDVVFEANGSGLAAANGATLFARGLRFVRNEKGLDVSNEAGAEVSSSAFEGNRTGARIEKASAVSFSACRLEGNVAGVEFHQMDRGARVRNCTFEDNETAVSADLYGNPEIEDTTLCRNGTGLRATQSSAPRVRRCCFRANRTALDLQKRSDAHIRACRLEANEVALFADFSTYPKVEGNLFRENRWHVRLGTYQSAQWEARHSAAGPPRPAEPPSPRRRLLQRPDPSAEFSVAGNLWDAATLAEMSAGASVNVSRFWDGRDREPAAYAAEGGAVERYAIDSIRYWPVGSRDRREDLPKACACETGAPPPELGGASPQRPRR